MATNVGGYHSKRDLFYEEGASEGLKAMQDFIVHAAKTVEATNAAFYAQDGDMGLSARLVGVWVGYGLCTQLWHAALAEYPPDKVNPVVKEAIEGWVNASEVTSQNSTVRVEVRWWPRLAPELRTTHLELAALVRRGTLTCCTTTQSPRGPVREPQSKLSAAPCLQSSVCSHHRCLLCG